MKWGKDCEDCKRRREAFIAAAKRMAEWIKNPSGPRPDSVTPNTRLPSAAPTSQEQVGRIDPKGRVRD